MQKYAVSGTVTVSCWTEVEAESKVEALEIAENRDLAEFHIDGTYDVKSCFMLDNDGRPDDLKIDEEQ